jgi:cell wall-associated NlpC family hydrolase
LKNKLLKKEKIMRLSTSIIKTNFKRLSLAVALVASIATQAQEAYLYPQNLAEFEADEPMNPNMGNFQPIVINTNTMANSTEAKTVATVEANGNVVYLENGQEVINNVLSQAYTFLGTPYRMGGNSRAGIDCSAFIINAFQGQAPLDLPRVSAGQAALGETVERSEVRRGDLLFFQTRGRRVSHVGIVDEVDADGKIKFIHASSSRGVTISSLNENYWQNKFSFARRVIH